MFFPQHLHLIHLGKESGHFGDEAVQSQTKSYKTPVCDEVQYLKGTYVADFVEPIESLGWSATQSEEYV